MKMIGNSIDSSSYIAKDEGKTGDLGPPEGEVEVVMLNHGHLYLVTYCGVREKMLR